MPFDDITVRTRGSAPGQPARDGRANLVALLERMRTTPDDATPDRRVRPALPAA
ncbi:hypothetical protein ACF09K_13365 [Streptomyces sp. NPDC014882]|uniref:hypothetical protein n=1 Tax=Streptomyces sp. NPDC014882 TaxID=3364927 RepID=UPI0036FDF5E7